MLTALDDSQSFGLGSIVALSGFALKKMLRLRHVTHKDVGIVIGVLLINEASKESAVTVLWSVCK
jgi:hypothetical protein